MYTRMLAASDDGGPTEVYLVMQKAPISWGPILNIETVRSTSLLYSRATDHEYALIHAAKYESSNILTADNLLSTLKRLGINTDRNRPFERSAKFVNSEESKEGEVIHEAFLGQLSRDECEREISSSPGAIKEAYQVLKKRQRPPPKGGYPYPKNDHVTTKMGRLPPSPCKVCGSSNHWDKECPDWDVYQAKQDKSAYRIELNEEEDLENYYSSVYSVLVAERLAKEHKTPENSEKDFDEAVLRAQTELPNLRGRKTNETTRSWKRQTMFTEEVEDEYWTEYRTKEKSETHLLYQIRDEDDLEQQKEAYSASKSEKIPKTERVSPEEYSKEDFMSSPHNESNTSTSENFSPKEARPSEIKDPPANNIDPPPSKEKSVRIPKVRSRPEGTSAIGVSVLSVRGYVGSLKNTEIDLRLDSCADITLISSEFYDSLTDKPKLKQGMRMQLWQLMDKDSKLKGFVNIPIYMVTENGDVVETEAEAYVVPNMTVPILLGEDFQQSYETCVTRNVEEGTHISFRRHDYRIRAMPVERTKDLNRLRQSAYMVGQFVRRRLHRHNKGKRHRRKVKFGLEEKTVRAAEDYRLKPHESKPIRVEGQLGEDRDWLVQKNLLANANDTFFAVPNVLISAAHPWVPIANPTDHPRYIRKGEIIGCICDPGGYFDSPDSPEEFSRFQETAEKIRTVIAVQMGEEDSKSQGEEDSEPEDYGPKTAAMPDPTIYPSAQLEDLIDVGSLPDHLKERAWVMLRKRIKAFGFDGRLGNLPAKVHIRTVDGQVPISLPMYSSSPEKRAIINEQIDTWFEQGVIEPSKNPWGAPIVIAYRNGKPRFCVDYRKLNAATIPDEFPIPRQSEILASLSGAQVLSSLDALSGFTQLELVEEDIEKTAFRTHRGLFQFRRLPFGLRNGPSIFQRVMQSILAPYLWIFCLVYIDDIVIYSKSYEEHIEHLDKVLEAIEKAGLTLSPKKCHLFYGSILLLGHKVSHLGLSTHMEKVKAIMELECPKKLSQLQAFLGMIVYFSAFIPYYASICAPLFQLLRKGHKWSWGVEQEHAFQAAKCTLNSSPVLGHPMEGLPYRLYSDASDEALGCSLQQVQPIKVRDLKGTRTYDRLKKAHENGLKPPRLVTSIGTGKKDSAFEDEWAPDFDDTTVHVERVIAYWSRLFKNAETRYSTTKREALAAKEGLVKFQPFIEGEDILLVTDHSALQWARTYENANRRLAAWGAIFSAYAPKLEIVHCAGRIHSNVDPLSRLPRAPPPQTSLLEINEPAILAKETLDVRQEVKRPAERMAVYCFTAWSIEDCLDFSKFGLLIPNPIPSRPYQSISMDFIVNLPWSDGYNAIYVVVDRLSKHASFIPTTTGLDTEGFAHLFVRHSVC